MYVRGARKFFEEGSGDGPWKSNKWSFSQE